MPDGGVEDEIITALVTRANLDAFWSRMASTVRKHVSVTRGQIEYGKGLKLMMYPPLGPFR